MNYTKSPKGKRRALSH